MSKDTKLMIKYEISLTPHKWKNIRKREVENSNTREKNKLLEEIVGIDQVRINKNVKQYTQI